MIGFTFKYCHSENENRGNRNTQRKPTNLSQVTDKLYHILLYQAHLTCAGFELTTLVVLYIDCTGSCKSKYHTITTTTPLYLKWNYLLLIHLLQVLMTIIKENGFIKLGHCQSLGFWWASPSCIVTPGNRQGRSNPYAKTQLRIHRKFWQKWKHGKSKT
jgi:magnesium-transporting ATPase (P-type)